MARDKIYEELKAIFEDVFDLDEDVALGADTTADDVDGWDSLNHIRMIMAVQKKFDIKLSTKEVSELKKLGDLVQLIETKTAGI
jgi:acyl carrier protein